MSPQARRVAIAIASLSVGAIAGVSIHRGLEQAEAERARATAKAAAKAEADAKARVLSAANALAKAAAGERARSKEGCASYRRAAGPLVAHAGGGLPARFYANNLAALNLAAAFGHKLIELDFMEVDGRLLLGHDKDRMSDLDLQGLIDWLDDHPGVTIVTDIKTDNLSGLELIKRTGSQGRFIPQIYRPEQYAPVRKLGFSRVIFADRTGESENWFPWVNTAELWAVAIPKSKAHLAEQIRHPVYIYTVNKPTKGVGLYTDCLVPL